MDNEERSRLKASSFMQSRIPALDALSTFVPKGKENDPAVQEAQARSGYSRWYPVERGHKVLILFEGGEYDSDRFKIEKGAWDHEHCATCGASIAAMTLCWVTRSGEYVILCNDCHKNRDQS